MSDVRIQRAGSGQSHPSLLEGLAERMQAVREKAFELFTRRGEGMGGELDDWIAAEREVMGWPTARFADKDGAFEVDVNLAGFTDRDVEVTATPRELIVRAATSEERKGGDSQVMWSEFGSRDVYRRFAFPETVNADKVTASLDHGILKVRAPRLEEAKPTAPSVEAKPAAPAVEAKPATPSVDAKPTVVADAPSRASGASPMASKEAVATR